MTYNKRQLKEYHEEQELSSKVSVECILKSLKREEVTMTEFLDTYNSLLESGYEQPNLQVYGQCYND